ncbi:stage II sporulation protein E [Bacillus sp. FSL K6-0273]|uniref:stage II sporulation protein E n=1 Tax=Bacillus TaxID=1386 RepID=UPI0008FE502F|nr:MULTISPECIES: stage II sporulation protein E [Bacillus cereus group]MDF9468897.1 stage II sporulation protein E [Bacillus cereus]OJE15930.1 stage II sporulation protein E [Bacillus thuringiensis]QWR98110.1 stage II sporulation protein E [Bacillus cereus]
MPKAGRNTMNTSALAMNESQLGGIKWTSKLRMKFEQVFFRWGFIIVVIGFLLGRAYILTNILPFALPFFAAVYVMKRDKMPLAFLALMGGALSVSIDNLFFTFASIFTFFIYNIFFSRFTRKTVGLVPFQVFISALTAHLVVVYFAQQTVTMYDLLVSTIEAGLSFVLTMIFLQSVPLLVERKGKQQALETEEIVCLIILLASVLTGTTDWFVYDASIQHIFTRYLVLVFAFIAGAATGSTVGVVTGLILSLANVSSLSQLSLLAFSGLLGGLLKEGKRLGVSLGLLIGTSLITLYVDKQTNIVTTLIESGVAIAIFLLTPKLVLDRIAKFMPGTQEHSQDQQQYLRRMRDVTANKINQFANVFAALSNSFSVYGYVEEEDKETEADLFLSTITAKTCQTCFKKDQCWVVNFDKTYDYMKQIMNETEEGTLQHNRKLVREWDKHCVRGKKVTDLVAGELDHFYEEQKLRKQMKENRRIVAEQLLGVSKVMEDFAKEIQRERENHQVQEEQIMQAFRDFGVEVEHVDIYCLDRGSIDIEMLIPVASNEHGECEKLVAPMLSDILKENIVVKHEEKSSYPNGHSLISFGSAKTYSLDTGLATAAKGGGFVSGDSYAMMDLSVGKYALAISDGMGNGQRAHMESKETVKLLQKILQSGIDEEIAIKSINSILSLRTTEEMFTTLDLAMVDLRDASARFLKIGSTPSFVKRANNILKIEASNLPMGIIEDVEVDVVGEQLKTGDILIMMSDGIFEGAQHVENHELWMKRKIKELQTEDPQEIADIIMEEVIRSCDGYINDDMTIVVAKVKKNMPKWATIPIVGMQAQ